MAKENLTIDINARDNASATVANVNKAIGGMSKTTRRSGQAFTQLAYALDDAQYGFRGIQNNLQQLAVTLGLGGPVVLGITALLIAIPKLIDYFNRKNKEVKEATKVLKEYVTEVKKLDPVEEGIKKLEAKQIEERARIASGYYKGKRKARVLDQIEERQKLIDEAKEKKAAADAEVKAEKEKQERLKREREKAALDRKILQGRKVTTLDSPITPSGTSLEQLEEWQRNAERLMKSFANVWGKEWDKIGQITVMGGDKVAAAIRSTAQRNGLDLTEAYTKANDDANVVGQALQSSLTGAITGFAEALGSGFDDGGFLETVSGFMKSFGAALIAVGVSKLSLEANAPGGVLIAAGVGLVAAATLLSAGGAGHFSGNRAQNSRRSYTSPSANATRVQGVGGSERLIGELELRGQNLLVALQAASETRNRF